MKSKVKYPVRTSGDPVLAQEAEPVLAITPEIVDLARNMVESMYFFDGIGLAAPQIGIARQLVVVDVPPPEKDVALSPGEKLLLHQMPLALVNPRIVSSAGKMVGKEEGCLSVPGIYAEVVRPERVVVHFTSLANQEIEIECDHLLARCLQHEIDHLHGIVFTDRLAPKEAERIAPELQQLRERGKRVNYLRTKKK
ncbi:MAG: peptide deformylase [Victivallaceae bacterium]|nr:peptide deformylase [Victivallaceae bacterium]